jgi:hypothetical protein
MITGVPLPGWRDLVALAGPLPEGEGVAAPWLSGPGDHPVWFSRSSWALHGLAEAWARRHGRKPRLWVPDYFCNATLDPVRRTGAVLTFYPVGADLEADWPECRRLAAAEPPDLLLLAHYFGCASNAEAARAFCDEAGALLIEDCAHVLAPTSNLGELGDFVLWSPHKLLAVPQGGLLICRGDALAEAMVPVPSGPAPSLRPWLLKRLVQMTLPAGLLPPPTRSGPQSFAADPDTGPMPATPSLSPLALKLLAAQSRDIARAAAARRANGTALLTALSAECGWQSLFDPATTTPYRLVMRCDSAEIAAGRFDRVRRGGVPVESWPDMPPEVTTRPERHQAALSLRATLLCFPVHQGLRPQVLAGRCA